MFERIICIKDFSLKPAFYSVPVDFEPGWGISVKFSKMVMVVNRNN